MIMKIYIDAETGELVVDKGGWKRARPAYSEIERALNSVEGLITLESIHGSPKNRFLANKVHFSDIQDKDGVPYANIQEVWDAIKPYFSKI